jgi:hypothetical protein
MVGRREEGDILMVRELQDLMMDT